MSLEVAADVDTARYARISEDRHDGAGIERQLEDARALCASRGWPAVEYADNNRSAWRVGGARPQYAAMLAAIRAGEIKRLVVWKTDRLYRQPRELEDLITLADRGRVSIVAVMGGELDLGTSDGRALARVLAAMNAKESDDKADRVRAAKRQAREKGEPHGGPRPFGWARRAITLPDGTTRLSWDPMRHDPVEARLIRRAVRDLLAGASLNDIARRWNAQAVPQPQTGRANWTTDGVRQVVSNPRNAGLVGHREELKSNRPYRLYARPVVIGVATWKPIVSRSTWEQLQALLLERGAGGKTPKRRSLLTGLLACGACGATMVRTADHAHPRPDEAGERYRKVWRCPTYTTIALKDAGKTACGNNWIDAAGVEALLVAKTLDKAERIDLAAVIEERGGGGREAAGLTDQLAELDRRAAAAASAFARGGITLPILERATAELEQARQRVRSQLAGLVDSAILLPYLGEPGSLREAWSRITIDQQREIIRILVGRVRIGPARAGFPRFDPTRVVPLGKGEHRA